MKLFSKTLLVCMVQAIIAASTVKAATYESFLDSVDALAKSIMPEKERLDSLKAAANAETPAPRDEFEKQADYEKRVADFEKTKQQKMQGFEQEYSAKTKEAMDKIKQSILSEEDLQPDWAGMLRKDAASIEEYKERAAKISEKIPEMEERISKMSETLGVLNFSQSEVKPIVERWQQKKQLYISRLEKAIELMQDYTVQEQAKILTTEKKKVNMTLGSYDADKDKFDVNINDLASTVPFDFSGTIIMPPDQARETNRQTDNFMVSVNYINYPFITGTTKMFPGIKNINVYYKDKELQAKGDFKGIPSINALDGYSQWAVHADSLLTGKLTPRNLDSMYAMNAKNIKMASSTGTSSDNSGSWAKTIRYAMFGLSAMNLVLGVIQDRVVVASNIKKAKEAGEDARYYYDHGMTKECKEFGETSNMLYILCSGNLPEQKEAFYKGMRDAYTDSVDDVNASENLRNGLYIGAGVFGAAGIVSFFF